MESSRGDRAADTRVESGGPGLLPVEAIGRIVCARVDVGGGAEGYRLADGVIQCEAVDPRGDVLVELVFETVAGVELPLPHVSFGQFPLFSLLVCGLILEVRTVGGALTLFALGGLPLTVFALGGLPLTVFALGPRLLTIGLPLLFPTVLIIVRHGGRGGEKHGQESRKQQEISQGLARHDSLFLR